MPIRDDRYGDWLSADLPGTIVQYPAKPIRDDSAGSYGTWNNDDLGWLDYIKANASDGGNALANLGRNLVDGFSPIGTSEQGNMALQVPPIAQGFADSVERLVGSPNDPGNAWNLSGVEELDAPILADGSNVLLSFTGGQAVGGLGRAVSGLAKGGAATVSELPVQRLATLPSSHRGFHGAPLADGGAHTKGRGMYWGSSDPRVADEFAKSYDIGDPAYAPNVESAQFNFQNPLFVGDDATRYWTDIPFEGGMSNTDQIARVAQSRGHDGVVFRNINEGLDYDVGSIGVGSNTYVALKPGTVTSPLTGETLFSDNRPSLFGSALATGGETSPGITPLPSNGQRAAPMSFAEMEQRLMAGGREAQSPKYTAEEVEAQIQALRRAMKPTIQDDIPPWLQF